MDFEQLKQRFRDREENPNIFKGWKALLGALYKLNPKDGNFYIITVNKGTDNERRSRFCTHAEAIELVMKELTK